MSSAREPYRGTIKIKGLTPARDVLAAFWFDPKESESPVYFEPVRAWAIIKRGLHNPATDSPYADPEDLQAEDEVQGMIDDGGWSLSPIVDCPSAKFFLGYFDDNELARNDAEKKAREELARSKR